MPSYALLRAEKLKSFGNIGGSIAHSFRTRETPNADPERTPENTHLIHDSPDAVMGALKERLPEKYRKDAVLAIEYFVGLSPEASAVGDREAEDRYFDDALEWLKERHGEENVISAHIHRDETTPHMAAYVVPRDGEKLNAKKFLGGKKALSDMQTDFAEKVGKRHGLERGLEGSRATHRTIKEFYGELHDQRQKNAQTASQEVSEVVADTMRNIDPKQLKAQVIEKGFFSSKVEDEEAVKKRLAKVIEPAVTSAVRPIQGELDESRAKVKQLQGERQKLLEQNKSLKEQFGEMMDLVKQMAPNQITRVMDAMRKIVKSNKEAEAERERQAKEAKRLAQEQRKQERMAMKKKPRRKPRGFSL